MIDIFSLDILREKYFYKMSSNIKNVEDIFNDYISEHEKIVDAGEIGWQHLMVT